MKRKTTVRSALYGPGCGTAKVCRSPFLMSQEIASPAAWRTRFSCDFAGNFPAGKKLQGDMEISVRSLCTMVK